MDGEIREISHQVYERTKNKILNLEFQFGERMNIKNLCEEFHVSPTPIREGIKKLIEDGLIEDVPRKGYYVYSPTPKDIQEIYELRKMLEDFALASIRNKIPDLRSFEILKEKIEYIQKQGDKEKKRRFIETESVHTLIAYSLNNQRINSIYQNLHNFTLLFQHIIQRDTIDVYFEDHLSLVNAIVDKDIKKAQRVLIDHTDAAVVGLCKLIKKHKLGDNFITGRGRSQGKEFLSNPPTENSKILS